MGKKKKKTEISAVLQHFAWGWAAQGVTALRGEVEKKRGSKGRVRGCRSPLLKNGGEKEGKKMVESGAVSQRFTWVGERGVSSTRVARAARGEKEKKVGGGEGGGREKPEGAALL